MKLFFTIKLKQLGTQTPFAVQALNRFREYIQYLAEVRELKRYNNQREKDVNIESENHQSDCVEG